MIIEQNESLSTAFRLNDRVSRVDQVAFHDQAHILVIVNDEQLHPMR